MTLLFAALLLFQEKDGADLVRKAVETTKAQKCFETIYTARNTPPKGSALDYEGRQVWVAPGILYMRLTGSAGLDRKVIRIANEVWIHSVQAEDWVTGADAADDAVARGIQHPIEVLELLGRQAAAATRTKTGASIELSGDDLKAALKDHFKGAPVAWNGSKATLTLSVDADGRLKTLACDASMLSNDPALPGFFKFKMTLSVEAFNTVAELAFTDDQGRPLAPNARIKTRIAQLLGGRK